MTDAESPREAPDRHAPVALLRGAGTGPLWGMASDDLNATLLAWPPEHEVSEHTNVDLDVLLVVLEGNGAVTVDHRDHTLAPGHLLLLEKGTVRTIRAGPEGLRYLSVHRRRGPLQISPLPRRP